MHSESDQPVCGFERARFATSESVSNLTGSVDTTHPRTARRVSLLIQVKGRPAAALAAYGGRVGHIGDSGETRAWQNLSQSVDWRGPTPSLGAAIHRERISGVRIYPERRRSRRTGITH